MRWKFGNVSTRLSNASWSYRKCWRSSPIGDRYFRFSRMGAEIGEFQSRRLERKNLEISTCVPDWSLWIDERQHCHVPENTLYGRNDWFRKLCGMPHAGYSRICDFIISEFCSHDTGIYTTSAICKAGNIFEIWLCVADRSIWIDERQSYTVLKNMFSGL